MSRLEILESEGKLMNASQTRNEKQQLFADQVRQLYKQAPIGIMTTPIVSLIVIIVLWEVSPHWILITWFLAFLLVSIFRYLLIVKFWGSLQTPARIDRFCSWFIIGAVLSGIVWGYAGIFLLPVNSLAYQVFIGIVICGLVAGAAGTYSAIIKAFIFFSLPALIPFVIKFFLFADKIHISIGSMALLFELMMVTNAKRINTAIVSSLKMRAENKHLIEKLKTEKEHAETILNSIQSGVIIIDAKTHEIVEVNPAATAMFGVEREEIVGHVCHRFICPAEGNACPITDRDQCIENEERVMLNKDGDKVSILKNVTPITLDRQECLLESFIDITKLKQVEGKLQELLLAIEQSPASVVVTDREGRIEYVNQKFIELTGYSKEESIGQNPRILAAGAHSHEFYKEMWNTILSGKVWRGEICNRKKNGELYWENASISPVFDERSEITHFVAVKEDITQKRYADQELQRAKEDAEAANRAKSEFLANMSHELRTPLNAIIGFSEVLQEKYFGDLNEKQVEYVTDILESGKHLLALINDILDLSKVEASKMELELSRINIKEILENSLVMIKEKAIKHDIKLDINIEKKAEHLEIVADERKLKQIMFNMLSNAVKFTPDGGTVTVEAKHNKEELAISVADTGIGIVSEHQEKIFEEFYQVRGGIKDKTAGTGLGLPLTKRLVEMHGGTIWVKSDGKNKGSRFSFSLPVGSRQVEEMKREELEAVTESSLLNHLNEFIDLAKSAGQAFSFCRLHIKPKPSNKKAARIYKVLEKEKRAYDFLGIDNKGIVYVILKGVNSEEAKAICNRLARPIWHVYDGLKASWKIAAYPKDGETPEILLKKIASKNSQVSMRE